MISLSDWLFERDRHFHLKGYVGGHPRYSDGTFVTTSPVEEIQRQGNVLAARTMSGTIYCMELAELNMENDYVEDTRAALKYFGFADSMLIEAGVLRSKKQAEMLESADKVLKNNELLLIMAGEETLKAYYKSNNKVEIYPIGVHIGMVQDSIIVGFSEGVDFRYFPKGPSCEVYHWSDGLKNVKIQNVGSEQITFYGNGKKVVISHREIKSLDKKIFANEGLFSPDCVDGKSVLSS